MNRLIEKTVFLGLVTCWCLAGWPDEPLALVGERDDRGGRAVARGVDEDLGLAALHDGDHRVGRAEVDADDLGGSTPRKANDMRTSVAACGLMC
jgi:hypothetical protein